MYGIICACWRFYKPGQVIQTQDFLFGGEEGNLSNACRDFFFPAVAFHLFLMMACAQAETLNKIIFSIISVWPLTTAGVVSLPCLMCKNC